MKKGFTLMELLIVIFIIGLMAVVAVPAFEKYGRKAELANKTDEVQILFERAYREAVSPKPGTNGTRVEVYSGSPSKIIYSTGNYDNGGDCKIGNFSAVSTETLLLNEYSKINYNLPYAGGTRTFRFCAPGEMNNVFLVNDTAPRATITVNSDIGSKHVDVEKFPYRVTTR